MYAEKRAPYHYDMYRDESKTKFITSFYLNRNGPDTPEHAVKCFTEEPSEIAKMEEAKDNLRTEVNRHSRQLSSSLKLLFIDGRRLDLNQDVISELVVHTKGSHDLQIPMGLNVENTPMWLTLTFEDSTSLLRKITKRRQEINMAAMDITVKINRLTEREDVENFNVAAQDDWPSNIIDN